MLHKARCFALDLLEHMGVFTNITVSGGGSIFQGQAHQTDMGGLLEFSWAPSEVASKESKGRMCLVGGNINMGALAELVGDSDPKVFGLGYFI